MSYSLSGNITGKTVDAMTLQAGAGQVHVDYDATYNYFASQPHAIESITGHMASHDFQWDANGNMTLHNDHIAGFTRMLCWDEENRLTAVRDENNLSAYIYDAGGERVWKLTGQVQQMYVDGTGWIDIVDLNNKTLYVSPYLVYNETGYSKHYYAGAERVSSRIGGGMQDALVDPLNYTVEILSGQDYTVMAGDLQDMLGRNIECTDMPMQYVSMEQRLVSIEDSRNHNNTEDNRYIYHSDHLGSSAFLTDIDGNPTQHLQYLPFGEPFIEQRSVTEYYTPYTFSAKERDLETGYSYFGARYYNSHISVWLSVDPLSDKYPGMSAYMYCAGNPVILVDPDGREMNPIYDWEGDFLGTDDKGLQGEAIVMKKEDFKQGMAHKDACKYGTMRSKLPMVFTKEFYNKIDNHHSKLPSRPDWDGFVTFSEATEWYRRGTGEPLFADLAQISLKGLISTGDKSIEEVKAINLFFYGTMDDFLVYGTITLKRYPNHYVKAFADEYNFELHKPFNPLYFPRNMQTGIGQIAAGKGKSYFIHIYGSQQLKTYPWHLTK